MNRSGMPACALNEGVGSNGTLVVPPAERGGGGVAHAKMMSEGLETYYA
ncbi:MAG: hypothetical protein GY854_04390, partial [Deltaproteobacteria bacterium]|nr:hypothetical protein [Deltaproteobacteria bacterium]